MMYESLLKKKRNSYEVFMFDALWTTHYCPYFEDLNQYFDEEHINIYNEDILSQLSRCNDKLIGLPLTLGYDALYSNKKLLKKYNKEVPKTWQQLLDTGKEILQKERALNNTKLIGYNGLLFDSETGFRSVYEFIHSCRENPKSPFPDLTSQTALDASLLLKKIKDEISSDIVFTSNLEYTQERLINGDALFIKFFVYILELMRKDSPYEMTNLPGIREGLSSTMLTGYNVGIPKNIDKNKLESALEVIKFLTSREIQKYLVINNQIISAITSIYEDEEVCASIKNCKMFKDAQPIAIPVHLFKDFNDYASRFTTYFYNFLYNNANPSKMLKAMDDLAKIYYIHINTKENIYGLVTIIVISVSMFFMLCSLLLLKIKKFDENYCFLSKPSWYIIIFGIISILSSGYTKIGKVSNFKCHLNNVLFTMGHTFIYIPILCKLLMAFPTENIISNWIKKNKFIFISIFIFISLLLCGLSLIDKYIIEDVFVDEGENYQKCIMNKIFTKFIYFSVLIYYTLIILSILLLIFIEWNLQIIHYDIRFILTSMYLNLITSVVFSIFEIFNIDNYILDFIIFEIIVFTISTLNFITLYCIPLLLPNIFKKNVETEIIEKIRVHESSYEKSDNITIDSNPTKSTPSKETKHSKVSTKSNSVFSKIIEYHYIR